MAVVEELIRKESDESISFGNHSLKEKAKKEDFECLGDVYKVKTYSTMTKLEKNGLFLYESVPGTSVTSLKETADGMSFTVSGSDDAQITVGLAEDTEYNVSVGGADFGRMKTNMGGKLVFSVELTEGNDQKVDITKA